MCEVEAHPTLAAGINKYMMVREKTRLNISLREQKMASKNTNKTVTTVTRTPGVPNIVLNLKFKNKRETEVAFV